VTGFGLIGQPPPDQDRTVVKEQIPEKSRNGTGALEGDSTRPRQVCVQ